MSLARTLTQLKILSVLNLNFYSKIESISKPGSQRKHIVDKSVYICVSYGTTFFGDACLQEMKMLASMHA